MLFVFTSVGIFCNHIRALIHRFYLLQFCRKRSISFVHFLKNKYMCFAGCTVTAVSVSGSRLGILWQELPVPSGSGPEGKGVGGGGSALKLHRLFRNISYLPNLFFTQRKD